MAKIISYQRPGNLEEALRLISLDKHVPLAGGTLLNTSEDKKPLHFVDLQGLPLKGIERSNGKLTIGSLATLDEIMKNSDCPDSIRLSSRSELPSTLRTLATIGGTVASGDSDSQLIASLLVHDAEITILSSDGESNVPLQEVLGKSENFRTQLILSIDLDADGDCVKKQREELQLIHLLFRLPQDVALRVTGWLSQELLQHRFLSIQRIRQFHCNLLVIFAEIRNTECI